MFWLVGDRRLDLGCLGHAAACPPWPTLAHRGRFFDRRDLGRRALDLHGLSHGFRLGLDVHHGFCVADLRDVRELRALGSLGGARREVALRRCRQIFLGPVDQVLAIVSIRRFSQSPIDTHAESIRASPAATSPPAAATGLRVGLAGRR